MLTFFLLLFAGNLFAQTAPPRERALPPSLQRELKLRGGKAPRIVSFTDTVKAQTRISQSIRDTSMQELDSTKVQDSAVVMIDSSVSLSHKELLDSMLAELPEYETTPNGGRFKYPPDILVETQRKTVLFDTTIYSHIEPVSRELLPYFDVLPLPLPITPRETKRFFIDAGVGAPSAPSVRAEWMPISSDKISITVFGNYLNRIGDASALKSLIRVGAKGNILFPSDDIVSSILPHLSFNATSASISRLFITRTDSSSRSRASNDIALQFTVGESKQLRLESKADVNIFHDEAGTPHSEQCGAVGLRFIKDVSDSSKRVEFGLSLKGAGAFNDSSSSLSLWRIDALYHYNDIAPFEWALGAKVAGAADISSSRTSILPIAKLIFRPTDEFTIGAAFAPEENINTLSSLSHTNLFYAFQRTSVQHDPRFVSTDELNIQAFTSYFLSLSDKIRGEVRFITRKNEVIFDKITDSLTGRSLFITHPSDTRRIEAELGANLLFFAHDELSATLHFTSATDATNDKALQYEPTFRTEASWTFRSLSEKLLPRLEFVSIGRKDRSLTFINAELHYPLASNAAITLRAENIFGSAGDFWDGYNEYPRSVLLSVRATF